MYTCINSRDNIVKQFETIREALSMATMCYDGAGIVCTILDSNGDVVAYDFSPSCVAYV